MSELADRLENAVKVADMNGEGRTEFGQDIWEAAERLRKLEAVREAAKNLYTSPSAEDDYEGWDFYYSEFEKALAACGDDCEHVWLHDIRQLTTKENRCTLCGKPKK